MESGANRSELTIVRVALGGAALLLSSLSFSTSAAAQTNTIYMYCAAGTYPHSITTEVFTADENQIANIGKEWRKYFVEIVEYGGCASAKNQADANKAYAYRRENEKSAIVEWRPSFVKPQGPLQKYTLYYKDGGQAGHGYDSASIGLNYRFLLCADEIQVAYGIDRKSLEHSQRYVVGPKGGGNMEYAVPTSEPNAPSSVALDLRVTKKLESAISTIAHLRDQFAGETLGMGCFTGQTKKIGLASALVGPKATTGQIKAFLDSLILAHATSMVAPDLDFPLTNVEFPPPPAPVRRPLPARAKRRT